MSSAPATMIASALAIVSGEGQLDPCAETCARAPARALRLFRERRRALSISSRVRARAQKITSIREKKREWRDAALRRRPRGGSGGGGGFQRSAARARRASKSRRPSRACPRTITQRVLLFCFRAPPLLSFKHS
jgi:hypothetical protein